MYQRNRLFLIVFYLILINFLSYASPSGIMAGETIRINGSGACLAMLKPLMEAYGKENRGISFQVEKPLGSSGAIKALLADAIDIAIVARPLKTEEMIRGARLVNYGKTPLAVITEEKVPVKNISTRELEDIYYGKIQEWPNGKPLRIILRPMEDADTKILMRLSAGMAEAVARAHQRRGVMIAETDFQSYEAVSRTGGGIGAVGLPVILSGKLPLNVLALNGIKPSRRNLANGTYPLSKNISFVTMGRLHGAAAKFLEFIYSNKGRAIAEKAGVLFTLDHP